MFIVIPYLYTLLQCTLIIAFMSRCHLCTQYSDDNRFCIINSHNTTLVYFTKLYQYYWLNTPLEHQVIIFYAPPLQAELDSRLKNYIYIEIKPLYLRVKIPISKYETVNVNVNVRVYSLFSEDISWPIKLKSILITKTISLINWN